MTTLSVDSSSLLMTRPNQRSWLMLIPWTMGGILLCLCRSSFLFLWYLVIPCIILITFMYVVLIWCSRRFIKVQHSLPKIRIGFQPVWWMICLAFVGIFLLFSSLYTHPTFWLYLAIMFLVSSSCVLYCTVLYCTVLYCTVLYCTVLYCTVLYCTVLYCTVLYCTVLYCRLLYCLHIWFEGLQLD